MRTEPERILLPATLDATSVRTLAETLAGVAPNRALVLEGRNGVFCRGLELVAVQDLENIADLDGGLATFRDCLLAIHRAARPTIALVDGEALAGGLGLAAVCDVVIATERASFGLPELLFGLVPAMILPILQQRTRPQRVRRLALEGQTIGAAEAHAEGLVDLVVEHSALEAALDQTLKRLSRAEPGAIGLLRRACSDSLPQAIDRGLELTRNALRSPAAISRIAAFEAGEIPWEAS